MRKVLWKAAALAAVLMVSMPALSALAQEKKAKTPAPSSTATKSPATTSSGMKGCGMKPGEMAEKPGCGTKGGAADQPGCGMKGETGAGMKCGGMKAGCGMQGGMDKGMMCGPGMHGGAMEPGMHCGPMGPGMHGGAMGRGMRGGAMGRGMGGDPGMEHAARMLRQLDLTPEQQKKVADIHERAQRTAIQAEADRKLATMDLQKLIHDEHPDQAKIDAQIDKLAQVRVQMVKSRVAALLEVRALLTPEQLKKWHELRAGDEEEED